MSEQCPDILRCDPQNLRQAMSIHTRKITDACRDKDCVEDLRVYLTAGSQQTLDNAANVRVRSAQLLHTYIDVEPVAFDRNHYCIDITFYYRILADAVIGTCRPAALSGLAVFSKRAVLCGEDSRAHIFTSDTRIGEADGCTLSFVSVCQALSVSSRLWENIRTFWLIFRLIQAVYRMSIIFSWAIREDIAPLRYSSSEAITFRQQAAIREMGDNSKRVMAMMGVPCAFRYSTSFIVSSSDAMFR